MVSALKSIIDIATQLHVTNISNYGIAEVYKTMIVLNDKRLNQRVNFLVKNPSFDIICSEFSRLTGIDLTHIFVVDGDFVRIGDPWYHEILRKEGIKWGARIGFVREADDQNNKIENYIGTLYSNGFEQSREFKPFRGKENKK